MCPIKRIETNKLPFYANYFHALSLSETKNIFNKDDQSNLEGKSIIEVEYKKNYNTVNLIEKIINPLEIGNENENKGILRLDVNTKNLMIPLTGLLVLPENIGADKVPLVLIGHGIYLGHFGISTNRNSTELVVTRYTDYPKWKSRMGKEVLSYKGYYELQLHLQKKGIASYSINLNIVNDLWNKEVNEDWDDSQIFNAMALDFNQRIFLFFLHLMLLKILAGESVNIPAQDEYPIKYFINKEPKNKELKNLDKALELSETSADPALQELKILRNELAEKINFEKLGFMGHSRGADAVSRIFSYFYKDADLPIPTFPVNNVLHSRTKKITEYIGKPKQDFIKSIVALEPTIPINGNKPADHGYVIDNDQTMFFAVAGALDEDVTIDAISIYEYPECPKAMIVIKKANHKRFNSVWAVSENKQYIAKAEKHNLISKEQHTNISKIVFGHCFTATLTKPEDFLFLTEKKSKLLDDYADFQFSWEFGYPFQTRTGPKVLMDLKNVVGPQKKDLVDLDDIFIQNNIKDVFYIESDNSKNFTIEIPIKPNLDDENLSKYTHFSFRFAKENDSSLFNTPQGGEKNFTIQLFENDSRIGKLITGNEIKSIKLRVVEVYYYKYENNKRRHKFKGAILLQTVEIKFKDDKLDLDKVNKIEITVIPDKTRGLPPSDTKLYGSTAVGAAFGAALGATVGYSVPLVLNLNIDKKTTAIISSLALGIFYSLAAYFALNVEKTDFVFKDFLLTNRKIDSKTRV